MSIKQQLGRIIVGQEEVIEELLITLFAKGHCMLEGVPGLAKTLMISTLARALSLSFSRIQFTPDLMPSDITGTEVIEENRSTGGREFKFLAGPLFANMILADEINRTPPKTQAALLEAMQERQVTVGRVRHRLDAPFFVLATQNPIEQEGTYPLPEAQQDRFMFKVFVKYPKFDEEFEIARRTTTTAQEEVSPGPDRRADHRAAKPRPPRAGHRPRHPLHAGPGAADAHRRAGRARSSSATGCRGVPARVPCSTSSSAARPAPCSMAASTSRPTTSRRWPIPVLRHRILTNFTAASEGISSDTVIKKLLDETPGQGKRPDPGRAVQEDLCFLNSFQFSVFSWPVTRMGVRSVHAETELDG